MEPKVRRVPQELYVNFRFIICGLDSVISDISLFVTCNGEKFQSVVGNNFSNNVTNNLVNNLSISNMDNSTNNSINNLVNNLSMSNMDNSTNNLLNNYTNNCRSIDLGNQKKSREINAIIFNKIYDWWGQIVTGEELW